MRIPLRAPQGPQTAHGGRRGNFGSPRDETRRRHYERSEAIHVCAGEFLDCFVALLLGMTPKLLLTQQLTFKRALRIPGKTDELSLTSLPLAADCDHGLVAALAVDVPELLKLRTVQIRELLAGVGERRFELI